MRMLVSVLLATVGLSQAVHAEEVGVDITSFRFLERGSRLAELCGKVVGEVPTPTFVKVTADHTSSRPGIYNVIVGPERVFCMVVVSYRGTASAEVWGGGARPEVASAPNQ